MTVGTEASHVEFAYTGVETTFPAGFSAKAASDVYITYQPAIGVLVTLIQGINVNVAIDATTGAVTVSAIAGAMPASVPGTVIIDRVTPGLQATAFANLASFNAGVHEDLHDRAALRHDELKYRVGRTILFGTAETGFQLPVKAARANQVIGFDGAGSPVLYPAGPAGGAGVSTPFTGDTGAGGISGLVPAPPAGSAALNKFLMAGGSFIALLASMLGFTQAGAGATARTVDAKLKEVVSILDFGADPLGAVDATAAMQAAINSGALAIRFPAGTYKLGAAGLTLASNQRWIGDGIGISTIKMSVAPSADMIYGTGQANFGFDGITFDGNNNLGGATSHFGVSVLPCAYLVSCTKWRITNCEFKGFSTCGLLANVVQDFKIENNVITRAAAATTQNYGILVSGGVGSESFRGRIGGNTCAQCQISVNAYDVVIDANHVYGWGFSSGINTQAIASCHDLVISGNHCHDSNQANDASPFSPCGIENWAPNSAIIGNVCHGNYGDGIQQGGANTAICGNVCYNQTLGAGIYNLYQSAGLNASGSVVCGNRCYDTRAGGAKTQTYGYREQAGGLTGIYISGNNFAGNLTGDVLLVGTSVTDLFPVSANVIVKAVNFNAVGDTPFAIPVPNGAIGYLFISARIANSSPVGQSLATATFGVFTQAAGAGTALIAGATAITVTNGNLGSANSSMIVVSGTANTLALAPATTTLFFRVTNPEGAAVTADVELTVTWLY